MVAAIHRDHAVVRFQVLIPQEVARQVRVEDQQGVTDVHVADHVEALLAREVLNAVGGEGRGRAVAVGTHAAAAVVIRRPPRRDLAPTRQAVDRDHARPALRRIGRHGERGSDDLLLRHHEREQQGRHCLGNTKRPPVPVIRLAWMFLKSGSEVKPVPLRC